MDREAIEHEPVLCGPVLQILTPRPGEVVVDATLGHGGHSGMMAGAIGPAGRLIALDVDERNIARARRRLPAFTEDSQEDSGFRVQGAAKGGGELQGQGGGPSQQEWPHPDFPRIDVFRANFAELDAVLDELSVPLADIILADLGVSTDQLLDPALGLTFTEDGPLDMRLDDRLETTAADLVNSLSERELADLIWENSQERFSRRIAKRICQVRREGRIRRTSELVRIVLSAMGLREGVHPGRIHPASRTMLALRMSVNHELENLKALLEAAARRLRVGGRIAVISFHSGEDRIVKQDFLDRQRSGVYLIRTRKPVAPTEEEIERNPRSRSAKLRVAERVA